MRRTALTLVGLALALNAFSQSISTQGKEFWMSFMQNGYYERNLNNVGVIPIITISAKQACNVTITIPNYSVEPITLSVGDNSIEQINLPKNYCYHMSDENESVQDKGIHIIADDTVSVYCANIANYSFDASFVLPVESLGDNYIVQCGEQSNLVYFGIPEYTRLNQTSAFLVVATEDNTTVSITPKVNTLGGHAAGESFEVTLNAGQTYHVRSNNNTNQRDLSGTHVQANKKIAVFNGNTLTRIPGNMAGNTGFDHIFEQAMPTQSWGKSFVVTQSMRRDRDFVKILSATSNNEIKKNGQIIATLGANQTYYFELSSEDACCYLESSQPSAVYLYNTSASDDKATGDPSMVWIAPIEQRIDEVTFATFNHENASIDHHSVNIIVKAEDADADRVYLDGNQLSPSEFITVNGNPDYKYTRISIDPGTHHLSCVNGLNAHVYGFGEAKGYAYMVGSKAVDITEDEEEEEFIHHNPEPENRCDSIVWHGRTYTTSGQYTDTVTNGLIHDIYHLDLNLTYSPTPKMNCASDPNAMYGDTVAVVTNTEFFSFQYDFSIEDTLGRIDNWEFYKWRISKPSWIIDTTITGEPDKRYCRVYVAERCDEYVELSCTVYNHCLEDSITCTFYLKSSFLGLDGKETDPAEFKLYPNPTNNNITLEAEGMNRIVVLNGFGQEVFDTKVYENTTILNTSQFSVGIYMICIYTESGMGIKRVSVIR